MREIAVPWTVGNRKCELKIVEPNGSSGIYHIYINKYYYGVMLERNGEWVGFFNGPDIGAEEITELGRMIDEGMK